MAEFALRCLHPLTNEQTTLYYNNATSELLDAERNPMFVDAAASEVSWGKAFAVSSATPGNKANIKTLKISLGLSCNYECSYCNQRFMPHADSTNPDDVQGFVDGLDAWVKEPPSRIEFWGGEPLVYWKTLKPLAELLRTKYPDAHFNMITNGSILDGEKNEWIDRMGFGIGLSHDGPGYHARGLDPLDNPEQKAWIMDLWKRLGPQRMSVNAMVHRDNKSRAAVESFLVKHFGEEILIGEGAYIDPYDEGGLASSLQSEGEAIEFRNQALQEIRDGKVNRFQLTNKKVVDFIESIVNRRPAESLGQKCGMDREENIAVDLKGNVITCQNTTVAGIAPNGLSHNLGHVSDLENVKLKTATHWSHRDECPDCPVLQLCKGSCMYLEGQLWDVGCDNSYSDNIPFLAAAIEVMTGFLPFYIEGPQRESRKDIFGLVHGIPVEKKKPFPIPVVSA